MLLRVDHALRLFYVFDFLFSASNGMLLGYITCLTPPDALHNSDIGHASTLVSTAETERVSSDWETMRCSLTCC